MNYREVPSWPGSLIGFPLIYISLNGRKYFSGEYMEVTTKFLISMWKVCCGSFAGPVRNESLPHQPSYLSDVPRRNHERPHKITQQSAGRGHTTHATLFTFCWETNTERNRQWTQHQVIYKPHCHYQIFSLLANRVYLTASINKTLLCNENCPITDPIAEMGVAHTVGHRNSIV